MKRIRRLAVAIAAVAAAGLLIASPPAQAVQGVIGGASDRAAGYAAGSLLGEEFRQLLEIPAADNPLLGNGSNDQKCLTAGHKDKILILWTTPQTAGEPTVCNVKPGTPIFFSTLFAECSSVEDPPFFGATEPQQRQCALDWINRTPFDAILVQVDNGPEVNIGSARFLTVSGQITAQLPDPNALGVPGNRQATFVVAAYTALVHPLPPGQHEITVTIVGGPYAGTNRATINVVHP